jgi:menaquinol-cytochrome c reductase iron-sulfur subunit
VADELDRPGHEDEGHGGAPHLPEPSIWPFGFGLGIALVLLGLVITAWLIVGIGAAIALLTGFLWIRDASRDMRAETPPEAARPVAGEEPDEEGYDEERYTRSVFLEGATLGIGAAIGAVVTLPALGFAVLPAFVDQDYESVDLGPLENFPEGQWVVAKFNSATDEPPDVSRRTAYVRNNGEANGAPSFTIISNRCVHLGCPVQPQGVTADSATEVDTDGGLVELFDTAPSGFGCPCHGGAYDIEGNRTAGPPVRALDRYRYSIQGNRLQLEEPYSVGKVTGEGAEAQMTAYDIADPGIHVDGLEQIFYPYVP